MHRPVPFRLLLSSIGIALTLALLARGTLFSAFSIPSASMEPTLQIGDHVLVTPYRYPWAKASPARGDVIVFRSPFDESLFFTKRIVAIPGDVLEIRRGRARINGVSLPEAYLAEAARTGERGAEIIPVDRYFVMGDHRSDSFDSRSWGTVPESMILGKARIIFWSAADSSHSPQASASTTGERDVQNGSGIRWSRLLQRIH